MTWAALSAVIALAGLLGAFLLVRLGRTLRRSRGLGEGRTVALDDVTLTSTRLGLVGKPDRLIRQGGTVIVEEWKSGRAVQPSHRAQMGAYFLLVADQWGVAPAYGVIVLGDGRRERIENSEELRAWVLKMAGQIRLADARKDVPIEVHPTPGQCRPCGMRQHCGQAR